MKAFYLVCFVFLVESSGAQSLDTSVSGKVMDSIYQLIKTPYKYGLVIVPENNSKKVDCPTVFRNGKKWFMTYIVFDGRGYETWLAKSDDLLEWSTLGKIMSFSDTLDWDNNQKAGYGSLIDYRWDGSYEMQKYKGNYWFSYIGGQTRGYEEGTLKIGIAYTSKNITEPHELQRINKPVLSPQDKEARWWERSTIYKSSIIWDKTYKTGHPFVMFYNAKTDTVERIGMAVSDNMKEWKRYLSEPVIDNHVGISGDAVIQQVGDVYVMFYFGAFWKYRKGAFNRFACSYDLVHWTEWGGDDLIASSESYDSRYAHKSFVIKYNGVVYHFYCAVNKNKQRGIAVATSTDKGKSNVKFPE